MSRKRFLGGTAAGKLGFCTAWAVDDHDSGREWVETVDVSMPVAGLADELCDKRIIHVSDLHCSRTVSERYLDKCVERVNQLDGDIVVLTGDYITHDFNGTYRQIAIDLIGKIKSRFGVYACLGNHDYGIGSVIRSRRGDLLEYLTEGMRDKGVKLLRNESVQVDVEGKPLWFVGLGDLWASDFNPDKAYSGIDKSQTAITLVHNPKSANHLKHYHSHAIMSGHTHGVQHPLAGAYEAIGKPKYHAGMYQVHGKQLYVNRGLGRLGQLVCSPRPEITVATLQPAIKDE